MGQGICLGSNAVAGYHDYAPDDVPGARMESGLDNSPMYDCKGKSGVCDGTECPACDVLFNYSTGQMQLIDVGMTSMVISEARHLAKLGDIIGHGADAKELRAHADSLTASMAEYVPIRDLLVC